MERKQVSLSIVACVAAMFLPGASLRGGQTDSGLRTMSSTKHHSLAVKQSPETLSSPNQHFVVVQQSPSYSCLPCPHV